MVIDLTPVVVVALLGWGLWVLARRAWDRMPLEKTPSPYSRSQARNRAGAAVYEAYHPRVQRVRVQRRRTIR
jgi:hypothetical protein